MRCHTADIDKAFSYRFVLIYSGRTDFLLSFLAGISEKKSH